MLVLKPETVQRGNITILPALEELFASLNAQGVRYCHWKSNIRLGEALQGKTDLDLLVDPQQEEIFEQALREHDILLFQPAPGRRYPGIENHLGYDPTTGKLFHLHVHYRLVMGEQFVKNYHLPLEEIFLDTVQTRYGVKIPAPELEIIILSLRALLKYRDRDGLKDILSIRSPGLPRHIQKEIEWLRGQTTRENITQMLENVTTYVPSGPVLEFLDAFAVNPRDGSGFLRLRREVRRALKTYQRQDRPEAALKYFRETWRRRSILKRPESKRMTLTHGGVRIAFVGADGAGKSTLIRELSGWLSWRLDVRTFYMGSSQPLWPTRLVKGFSKFAHRIHQGFQNLFGIKSPLSRLAGNLSRFLENLRFLFEARDRYHRYQVSCREVDRGALVFYDRYPLEAIRIFNRPMDGPRIASSGSEPMGWVTRKLSDMEQELYREIQPPDQVIILKVHPEISQARKPEHKWDLIVAKNQALQEIARNGFELAEVDANQPLDQVLRQAKPVVWRLLE